MTASTTPIAARWSRVFLNEKTYALIDELEIIAKAHETNVASVALAWVHAQPAVSSIIIGARRLSQLDDNVRAVDVNLSAEELARLDALTKPRFGFPHNMLEMAPGIINGGTTINGVSAPISEYVMPRRRSALLRSDAELVALSYPSASSARRRRWPSCPRRHPSPRPSCALPRRRSTAPLSAEPSGNPR